MLMLDKLSAAAVESGKEHPFVVALLRDLKAMRASLVESVISGAATGTSTDSLHAYGGRAYQLGWVISQIEDAGKERSRSD